MYPAHHEGAEIIGLDSARGTYATQFYGGDDATAYEASLAEEDGTLVWTMVSARNRFRGTFNAERDLITGHWDLLDGDSEWQSWMDITLTKSRRSRSARFEGHPRPPPTVGGQLATVGRCAIGDPVIASCPGNPDDRA